jgi:hypothetical protein
MSSTFKKIKVVLFFIVLIQCNFVSAQELFSPVSGNSTQSFSFSSGNTGAIEKSLNLHTGDVQFPIPLASLPDRNGIGASLVISYNSNTAKDIKRRNEESPTGIVGLGWSLDFPKIIVDNKSTGSREDDNYYLVENAAAFELSYVGQSAGIRYYKTSGYNFWNIEFDQLNEKWKLVKEDGTTYVYGDKNSNRYTVQWVVNWGNWIGASSIVSNQSKQGLVWNLSQITNLWNESILYSYLNVEEKVGSNSGLEHTEASYLYEIVDFRGRKIQCNYGLKSENEFIEPHIENGINIIDAYQERFEDKYLDYVNIFDEGGLLISKTDLNYENVGSGNFTKRLLVSVKTFSHLNNSLRGYEFTYYLNDLPSVNFGALQSVKTPLGGVITYEYTKNIIPRSKREIVVPSYAESSAHFAEPSLWFGENYVVIARRQLAGVNTPDHTAQGVPLRLDVYTWNGEWVLWNRTERFENIKLYTIAKSDEESTADLTDEETWKHTEFKVTVQKDFFAALYKSAHQNAGYEVAIYRKENNNLTKWTKATFNPGLNTDTDNVKLISGEKYVAITSGGDNAFKGIATYTWQGNSWTQSVLQSNDLLRYDIGNGINYIVISGSQETSWVKFFFLLEDGTWKTVLAPSFHSITDDDYYTVLPPNKEAKHSQWSTCNSFAVVLADNNDEYFYTWSSDYSEVSRHNTGLRVDDRSPTIISNNSLVAIIDPNGQGYTARYNGLNWNISTTITNYAGANVTIDNDYSFGDDFLMYPKSNGSGYDIGLRVFNPNTSSWSNSSISTSSIRLLLAGANYFIKVNESDVTKANFYYRKPDGQFVADPTAFSGLTLNDGIFEWQAGNNFAIKTMYDGDYANGDNLTSLVFENFKIEPQKIGFQTPTFYSDDQKMYDFYEKDALIKRLARSRFNVAGNTIATFLWKTQVDAREIKLYKFLEGFITGSIEDHAVTKVLLNDGEKLSGTFISYQLNTATISVDGTTTFYNKATLRRGGSEPNQSLGYTESYFFNGLTNQEVGQTFPTEGMDYENNVKLVKGGLYKTVSKNGSDVIVSETISASQSFYKDVGVKRLYYVRPFSVTTTVDGISSYKRNLYNETDGQLHQELVYDRVQSQNINPVKVDYYYWWQAYDPNLSSGLNLLTPVIRTKREENEKITSTSAVVWKNWGVNNVPAPYKVYQWRRVGNADFSIWDESTSGIPSDSEWKLNSEVLSINDIGLVTQAKDRSELINASIYDSKGRVIVDVVGASIDKVLYYSFEECSSNCVNNTARAGYKSLYNTSLTINVPQDSYYISYWERDDIGSEWVFKKIEFTGASYSLNAQGKWVDEVRVYPKLSLLTTYVYDRFDNVIAVCDSNNSFIFSEYDEFNRLNIVKDEDGNIVQKNSYGLKN